MVKGTHRQMVVLRTHASPYYEEAYFVLREGRETSGGSESMVAEANRILDESQLMPQPRTRRSFSRRAAFVLGALLGGGVAALGFLLFSLF